ncbi:MAG TPA: glycosyltransferase family 4 protein [Ilumatobacter sp.]|nr:glycosyltransferase family 4 protein [Ilumatobacter sp.]
MSRYIEDRLPRPPIDPATIDSVLLDECFVDSQAFEVDPSEFRTFDRFDHTIAIAEDEAAHIRAHTRKTAVVTMPMTSSTHEIGNTWNGPAVFPTGPTVFNLQGYLWFVGRVLPTIREQVPDFELRMTGWWAERVVPEPNVVAVPFIPSITDLYADARFLVCPLLTLTGQQVKVVEAMAHGVAPIVTAKVATRSPIEHGRNGLIATSAEGFAEHVIALWQDAERRAELGQAARLTVETTCAPQQLVLGLDLLLTKGQPG